MPHGKMLESSCDQTVGDAVAYVGDDQYVELMTA
jgi:hypothetical protein